MRIAIIIFSCLTLLACSTKYQDMGFTGGVEAQQMSAETFRIVARGNGWTNPLTIQDYAMLKAAETTQSAGYTHFAIISGNDASTTTLLQSPGSATTSVYGNTAYTTYNPGSVTPIFHPGRDIYIRVFRIPIGSTPPAGLISAEETIRYVGPRVKRG